MSKQSKRHMGLEVQGDLVTSNSLMFRNVLINGNFDVWQRGTTGTSTTSAIYVADRWTMAVGATGFNYTYAQSTDVPNLTSLYSAKITQSAGGAATAVAEYAIRQKIELSNVLSLVGKSLTVSFWYKSSVAGTHAVRVFGSGMTGSTDVATAFTINAANTWQYITLTFSSLANVTAVTGASNGAGLFLDIGFTVYNTSGSVGQTTVPANASFNIAQVQLEAGSSASAFEHRPYGMELALCHRYYEAKDLRWLDAHYVASTNRFVAGLISCTYKRATPAVNVISGTIYWANGAVILSAVSNAGLSFIATTNESIFLYQTRQVGNSTPASNEFVFMESGIVIGINAEL